MDIQTIIIRLVLAVVLSGLIGMEREEKNRPAGFRTHILVCVGSTLVMLTSVYIFEKYREVTTMDPARLGAQVISGIGFLGAGTIIRHGPSVKGLTTAASLWAVACVGIAIGIGFYEAAIAGALIVFITLILLSNISKIFYKKSSYLVLAIELENNPGSLGEIGIMLGRFNINIRDIEFIDLDEMEEKNALVRFTLKLPHGLTQDRVIKDVSRLRDVKSVEKV